MLLFLQNKLYQGRTHVQFYDSQSYMPQYTRKYCEFHIFCCLWMKRPFNSWNPSATIPQTVQVPLYHKKPLSHSRKLQPVRCQRWAGRSRAAVDLSTKGEFSNMPRCLEVLMWTGSCLDAAACQRAGVTSSSHITSPSSMLSRQHPADRRKEHGGPADQTCGSAIGKGSHNCPLWACCAGTDSAMYMLHVNI